MRAGEPTKAICDQVRLRSQEMLLTVPHRAAVRTARESTILMRIAQIRCPDSVLPTEDANAGSGHKPSSRKFDIAAQSFSLP